MEDLNSLLVAFTGTIDDFMYTYILVILLVATGIWFTIRTRCVQIRYIKDMFTNLVGKSVTADTQFSDDVENNVDTASCPRLQAPPTSTAARPMRTPRSPRSSVASRRSRRSWFRRPHALARATLSASRRRLRLVARAPFSGCGSWPSSARHRHSSSRRLPRSGRCAILTARSVVAPHITFSLLSVSAGSVSSLP